MANENQKYVLWRRVSTKEQGDSELGLRAQTAIAEYYMNHPAEKVFTDVYTGTKLSECKNLWAAIDYCKNHGLLLVIAKTDRFRNVIEALTVLDEIGEGNLMFCDLPTTDRTVLTIVFALWERQAIQGRINTKVALDERRKQLERNGYFISKAGNACTHLGNEKGCDMSAAREVACTLRTERAVAWREQSPAYAWVKQQVLKGKTRNTIIEEFNELHESQPEVFSTRAGAAMSKGVLSKWIRQMNLLAV